MKNNYQNNLINIFISLQSDLKSNKINEDQFNFLLGILLKTELNSFLKEEINSFLPDERDSRRMNFLTYKRDRKFQHAN